MPPIKTPFAVAGVVFSGQHPSGHLPEIVELPQGDGQGQHPFFIGVQFHPEFGSRPYAPTSAVCSLYRCSKRATAAHCCGLNLSNMSVKACASSVNHYSMIMLKAIPLTSNERRISLTLVQYWNQLRGDNPLPREEDINPDRLIGVWERCFLVQMRDLQEVPHFNYSYFGPDLIRAYQEGAVAARQW
jgi:hypothetical protein